MKMTSMFISSNKKCVWITILFYGGIQNGLISGCKNSKYCFQFAKLININVCYASPQNLGHIVDWENLVPASVPVSQKLCLFEVQFNP
jgi:hypothetical protein